MADGLMVLMRTWMAEDLKLSTLGAVILYNGRRVGQMGKVG